MSTTIRPTRGKPGHRFTIHDRAGRLDAGSRAVFTDPNGHPFATDLRTKHPYKSAHGQTPADIPPETYLVTVLCGSGTLDAGSYLVVGVEQPTDPAAISPTMGPAGTAFTILDPQNRIQPGDQALFYLEGESPLTGIPATNVVISGNNTLQGKVPQTANTNMLHYVAVRPTPDSPSRFEDLAFTIT